MKIALCLLGGGAMGAMFQIGALAALEDSVEGFQTTSFDVFLGSSAGASVAAALAGGQPVQRIYRAFLDPADVYFGLERGHLLRVDLAEWRRTLVSAAVALRHGASSLLAGKTSDMPAKLSQELDRLYDSLPAGIFTLDGYERFLEAFFVRRGVPNSFLEMPRALRIVAHDLDSGEPVAFGAAGLDRVAITRACIASMAIPPLFSPVRMGDRHYISSGAAEVEQLELAVAEGADVLVVVRPMVAITAPSSIPTGHGERDSLRDKGMMWVFNQARRIGVQRSVEAAVARIREAGQAEVLLLQPQREDGTLAMYNPASYDARRGMLEHAYRQTRAALARAFAERHAALERAGFVQRQAQTLVPPASTSRL
ncbi:MAG TPA: patatin-like phospholipase family protein [Polyangiaceae bacterium]